MNEVITKDLKVETEFVDSPIIESPKEETLFPICSTLPKKVTG
jgi:hypothetical protein